MLILLIDLVARGHLGPLTSLILKTGKEKQTKDIDVVERGNCIGSAKSQRLVFTTSLAVTGWEVCGCVKESMVQDILTTSM